MDAKTEQYLLYCGIKKKWHDMSIKNFHNDDDALEKVQSYLSKYKEALKDGVGLYLYGSNGTGKSLLMNTLYMDLLLNKDKTVCIVSIEELVDKTTESWYNKSSDNFTERLKRVDFLGIDEFGKNLDKDGNPVRLPDLVKRIVESVIRHRVQMKKPICFASNTDVKYVKDVFSEDIASLLNEAVIPIRVTGEDFRKKIQAKIKDKYL